MIRARSKQRERSTRSSGRRHGAIQRAVARITLLCTLSGPLAGPARAGDTTDTQAFGGVTTSAGSGSFTIDELDHTEFTQSSQSVILDWSSDLQQPADHTLGFRQGAGNAVLNRSPGVRASNFYGTVTCDATCIFSNEAGIYFQDGSFVDVGRVIAVGGSISNQDFLSGDERFTGITGPVENHGMMQGESITLIGRQVANFGHIDTPGGSFMMLAGDEVWLRDLDSPVLIGATLPRSETASDGSPFGDAPAVENAGTISAEGGRVRLAAGDMLSFAIRQSGQIRADEIALEGGAEGLVEVSGSLDASRRGSDELGGTVHVLGDFVSIQRGAVIDASGGAGGGQVKIGGDRQGQGALLASRGSFVHAESEIRADALDSGDGGEVIVWSDGTTQAYGRISARGGPNGGNGGFAETSGKLWLDVGHVPDLRARSGLPGDRGGEWLIDPNNIDIVTACGVGVPCLDSGLDEDLIDDPTFAFTGPVIRPTQDDSELAASKIIQALSSGVNVTITTESVSQVGAQDGRIRVLAPIEIKDDGLDIAPDTRVLLALLAANDIEVHENIGVTRNDVTRPSKLTLDVVLWANDQGQPENPAPVSPETNVPNQYVGGVLLDAVIESAGGDVTLLGTKIEATAASSIRSDGGQVRLGGSFNSVGAVGGPSDIRLLGMIDTSTQRTDQNGDPVSGGSLSALAMAQRRPETGASGSPTVVVGGDIEVGGEIRTGGGFVDLQAEGGDVDIDAKIDSGSGFVGLRAGRVSYAAVTAGADDSVSKGGRITLGESGSIVTDGGGVEIGASLDSGASLGATEIVIQGDIDTRVVGDDTRRGGSLELLSADSADRHARVVITGAVGGPDPSIQLNGGFFSSMGTGSFYLEDAQILAGGPNVSDDEIDSNVVIRHDRGVDIRDGGSGATRITADGTINLAAGLGDGTSNLTFSGGPRLEADDIRLNAGDGYSRAGEAGGRDSTVVLGGVVLASADGSQNPTKLSIQQDASLQSGGSIVSNLQAGSLQGLAEYTLAAFDGELTLDDVGQFTPSNTGGLDLALKAGNSIVVQSDLADAAVARLALEIEEGFVVDATLAANISGAAKVLEISAGTPLESGAPSLIVKGSLEAEDELVLHAGSNGVGDLTFEDSPSLRANKITLWAGTGDAFEQPAVRIPGNLELQMNLSGNVNTRAFTLRQGAPIDDASVPAKKQVCSEGLDCSQSSAESGVAGVDYTLRSDAGGIMLGTDGSEALEGSDLRLYARDAIVLDADVRVASMDIGGLGSFEFTKALHDRISYVSDVDSKLILRAGLRDPGARLTFAADLERVQANEIRLVAGDSGGGNGAADASTAARIELLQNGKGPVFERRSNGGGGEFKFVFRQDAQIADNEGTGTTPLPSLANNFDGNAPTHYAVRSDDGLILFSSFVDAAADHLPVAESELVLSASSVLILRRDGVDLTMDDVFGTPGSTQIRATTVSFEATSSDLDPGKMNAFLPGSKLSLMEFDNDAESPSMPGSPPAPIEFQAPAGAPSPRLVSVVQEGDIGDANLIDLSQIGLADPELGAYDYALTSTLGSITLTPDKVVKLNSAMDPEIRLSLRLSGVGPSGRSIVFDGTPGSDIVYDLASLSVVTPFGLVIEDRTGAATPERLRIQADEFLRIEAGRSNAGDLSFSGQVTLRSEEILLAAGHDPSDPTDLDEIDLDLPEDAPRPVVHAYDTASDLRFQLQPRDTETGRRVFFGIRQQGSLTDGAPTSLSESRIPGANQFELLLAQDDRSLPPVLAPEQLLDEINLVSHLGSIDVASLFDTSGNRAIPAKNLFLETGGSEEDAAAIGSGDDCAGFDGCISLRQNDQNLDLTVFDSLLLVGEDMRLVASGADRVVLAKDENIRFFGPESAGGLPKRFLVKQQPGFDSSVALEPCKGDCLPDRTQFGTAQLPDFVSYTIETTGGSILLDDTMTDKVLASNLTLLASNPDLSANAYDVKIFTTPVESSQNTALLLASLIVGDVDRKDSASPTRIQLVDKDPGNTANRLAIGTEFDQIYNGSVTIVGSVEAIGETIVVAGTLDGTTAGADEFIASTAELAQFEKNVGEQFDLARLRVNFNTLAPGTPSARFGGDAGGATTVRANSVEFYAVNQLSDDAIVTRVPLTSSIYKTGGDLSFFVDTLTMGQGEKLSVQGNLLIDASAGSKVSLGDTSALTIDLRAPTIELVQRPSSYYFASDGSLRDDAGVDFVANSISLSGNILLTGFGSRPSFGIADPANAPVFMDSFPVAAARYDALPLTAADFDWLLPGFAGPLPDLHPDGSSRDDFGSIYFGDDLVPAPRAWLPYPWLPVNRELIGPLDLATRPLTAREYHGRLAGAAIIDDVGRSFIDWGVEPLEVADARLDGQDAARAVEIYDRLFGPGGSRTDWLRSVLQDILDDYVRTTGARRVVGFELRRFVKNRPSSQFTAYKALEDLDALFTYHRRLGLSPGEYRPIQSAWLGAIKPNGISAEELAEAIRPSHYVRGSDVLDIFGE